MASRKQDRDLAEQGDRRDNQLEVAIGRQVRHFRQQLDMTVVEVAKLAGLSPGMLSKIENGMTSPSLATLQALSRAGIVRSQRGLGGGVSLAQSPEKLTILSVLNAVEPLQRIRTCPLGLSAHGVHLCPLHRRLDNALAMVEEAFGATTLAEVLAEPSRSAPLCNIERDIHRAQQPSPGTTSS